MIAKNGGIAWFVKYNKKKKLKIPENNNLNYQDEKIEKNQEKLIYYNGYGGFTEDGKEYHFAVNKNNNIPTIWSNIISNNNFGIITTENMYDLVWNKNSRLNRILDWNNKTVLNIPSQIIYLKDEDKDLAWTLNSNILPNSNYYYITYGFGYSKYKNVYDGILQETDIFVPNDENVAITKIRLKNTENNSKNLKILVYLKTILGEDESKTIGNCYFEKNNNIIYMKNMIAPQEFNKISYFTSNQEIKDFTKSKKIFFGNGNLNVPDSLFINNFESSSGIGDCLAVEFEINLKEYEDKFLILKLGQENSVFEIENNLNKFESLEKIDKSLNDVSQKWSNYINNLIIKTPEDDLNILGNGWLIYQTISCRLWAKSGFYQSGGAIGFRDQLQDCLGMKYIDINLLKEQILKCSRHQFLEGDVLHWWHEETKRGIRTKFSDDLLWLPFSVYEYVIFSSDYSILDEETEFLTGEILKENEAEKYNIYFASKIKEPIYNHCLRAIDKACNFGENGLPKIGSRRLERWI